MCRGDANTSAGVTGHGSTAVTTAIDRHISGCMNGNARFDPQSGREPFGIQSEPKHGPRWERSLLAGSILSDTEPCCKGEHPVARTQCQTASNHAITLHTCFGSPSLKTKHDFPSIPSAYPGPHPAEPEDPPGGSVRAREFAGIPGCCLAKGRSAHSRGVWGPLLFRQGFSL